MIDALLKKFCRWNRYRAWSDGSIWLSLDRFERFWPDAGLALSNGEYRREKPDASPLIGVRLYLTRVGFDRTWAEVVASTIRADIDALVRWNMDFRSEHDDQIPDYAAIIPENVHGPY